MSTTEPQPGPPRPASTSGPRAPASGPLARALVDDAAVFPPGNAPLPDAVDAHLQHRRSGYGPAVGPLLVRLSDAHALDALLAGLPGDALRALEEDGTGLGVGLVCPAEASTHDVQRGITDVQRHGLAVVRAIEQPVIEAGRLSGLVTLASGNGARVWAEVPAGSPLDGTLQGHLDVVRAAGSGAKFRTGGLRPEAFPTEQQVARFVLGCIGRDLPFKLTAGLHHAVRHTAARAGEEGSDLQQHGLLNVVNAVAAALAGADETALAALLADRDAGRVAAAAAGLDEATLGQVREAFASFGCCGVTDPLSDLDTLGLLETGLLERPADKETS
jgi:hypothetical protein